MSWVALNLPNGLVGETVPGAEERWRDGSNVRFGIGGAEVVGGWERLCAEPLDGVCRGAMGWSDGDGRLNLAFGTHASLKVWRDGELLDVTPVRALPAVRLAPDPVQVVDGADAAIITHPGHGLSVGELIRVTGAANVGRVPIAGDYAIAATGSDTYELNLGAAVQLVRSLAPNPISVTAGSSVATITDVGHGLAQGTHITISGAAPVGGLSLNGGFQVSVIDANAFSVTASGNAATTQSGGGAGISVATPAQGGGSGMVVEPLRAFAAGTIDGAGGAGYGTGAFSSGAYSLPATGEEFPRTWSLAAWGRTLVGCPRGGAIFGWDGEAGDVAKPVSDAPRRVTAIIVAPQDQLFALGCSEESSGEFNPLCIRHSSVRKIDEWRTAPDSTAREYILPGGGSIVAGRVLGSSLLVWTTHALFLGVFVGAPAQPWRFDRVGERCGLIGPNAAVVSGQQAFWIAPDLQVYRYVLGGGVERVQCPLQSSLAENLAPGQGDKVFASTNSAAGEVRFDYPDVRDGLENSRYLSLGLIDGAWSQGVMPRSAVVDAGPSPSPVGVAPTGEVYWHERGRSADGGPLAWFIETGDLAWSAARSAMVRGVWPDFPDQHGPVLMTVTARAKPQGPILGAASVAIAPGASRADLRLRGRYFRLRFEGRSSPARWRFRRPLFDVTEVGER